MVVLAEGKTKSTRNLGRSQKIVSMRNLIEKIIKKRKEKTVNTFNEFINRGEKILDIGAGSGWIGEEIQKRKNVKVALLDIINFNQTNSKLVLYDGENIPFANNYFDTSLLISTLHHCLKPLKVLEEARRVTKKKIIIIEDVPTPWINKVFLYLWDFSGYLITFLVKPPGEGIPFNFKKVSGWQKIFKDFQLKIIFQKEFQSYKVIRHVLFVVQKC